MAEEMISIKGKYVKNCIKLQTRTNKKHEPVPEIIQEKIFNQWISNEDNSYPKLAKDFGVTVGQVRSILNIKMDQKKNQF